MKNRDPWRDHPHLFLIFFKTCGLISMISHDLPTYFHHISPHFIASFQVVFSHHVGKSPITWLPYVAICCHDFPQLFHHISHSSHILLNFFFHLFGSLKNWSFHQFSPVTQWHLRQDLRGFEFSARNAPGPAAAVAQLVPHEVHSGLGRQDVPNAVAAEQQKLVFAAPGQRTYVEHMY